jgi:hypothetical protein
VGGPNSGDWILYHRILIPSSASASNDIFTESVGNIFYGLSHFEETFLTPKLSREHHIRVLIAQSEGEKLKIL